MLLTLLSGQGGSSQAARVYWLQDQEVVSVQADLSASYSVVGPVVADFAASYSLLAAVTADLAASYSLLAAVTADLAASYTVNGPAQGPPARLYWLQSLVSQTTAVTADLAASYLVSSTFSLRVTGAWSPAVQKRFLVLSPAASPTSAVASDLTADYAIGGSVTADAAFAYAVRQSVEATIVALYTFETAPLPGVTSVVYVPALDHIVRVDPLDNTVYVLRE